MSLRQRRGTSASLPLEAFVAVDVKRDGCAAGLPKGISSCAPWLRGATVVQRLCNGGATGSVMDHEMVYDIEMVDG